MKAPCKYSGYRSLELGKIGLAMVASRHDDPLTRVWFQCSRRTAKAFGRTIRNESVKTTLCSHRGKDGMAPEGTWM